MVRLRFCHWLCVHRRGAGVLGHGPRRRRRARALLDKATDTKLAAENVADLNEVIKLCQDAIEAGLDEGNTKVRQRTAGQHAHAAGRAGLHASCSSGPSRPNRGRKLVQMALADLEETLKIDAEQGEAQYLIGRLYAHLGETEKALKALDEAVRLSRRRAADQGPGADHSRQPAATTRPSGRPTSTKQSSSRRAIPTCCASAACTHLTQNKLEAAMADFDAAIALRPQGCRHARSPRRRAVDGQEVRRGAWKASTRRSSSSPNAPARYTHRGARAGHQGRYARRPWPTSSRR